MTEFFARLVSNPAPFFGDTWEKYVTAESARAACHKAIAEAEKHPAGAYRVFIYSSADAFHKNKEPLCSRWGKKAFGRR